ncbi:MAG: transposase [Clostridia bacterium]|nr:transposase [Clostridia bacterium]
MAGFDYTKAALYFITICTEHRRKIFWAGEDGTLSKAGTVVRQEILELPDRFAYTEIERYAILPDHVHLMIALTPQSGDEGKAPNIRNVVGSLKARVSGKIGNGKTVWQKSFYDHIIRNEKDYQEISKYIAYNPCKHYEIDCRDEL